VFKNPNGEFPVIRKKKKFGNKREGQYSRRGKKRCDSRER
jgi:hypothetical protein